MRTIIAVVLVAAATVTASLAAAPARAQTPAEFYRGKTLNLIIPNASGGSFDLYARLAATHLGRFIPGNPTIVPQNMPGAGGLKAATYIYRATERDGLSLATFGGFSVLEPLFGNDQANFDPLKFTWVGNMNRDVSSCAVWSAAGFDRFDDILQKEMI